MPRSLSVTVPNADGDDLAARLDLPDGGRPHATALFAHCFTCSKDLRAVREIARRLSETGIGVLSVDFTGLGASEGAFEDTSFSTSVSDLVCAADWLAREHDAPQLVVGHSLGGAAALVAAARLPSVRAVATIAAPCDPGHVRGLLAESEDEIEHAGRATVDIGGRPFTIRREFLDDLDSHDQMRQRVAALGRALIVLHSPTDQTVGIEQARHLFEAARHPKSFVSLDGADHLLSRPADARYVADVLAAWAGRYLSPGHAPPGHAEHAPYDDPVVTAEIGASGFQTALRARGFAVTADEPSSVGGTESGPTPYDLLAMALGACTAMTVRMYADRKAIPLESVGVTVTHDRVHADDCGACQTPGARLDRLTRVVRLDGPLAPATRERLLEIADRCPVHRTLESEVQVVTRAA